MTTLLDMTSIHIPVLAGELIELLDPQPGAVAVDCTVGGGGHARLIADRIGPGRHADRDRPRPDRRGALRRAGGRGLLRDALHPRRLRERAGAAARGGRRSADLVYLDLGMSSMQVDTWERGFSYAYDAPLDMRMDPDQELTAREVVNEWDERRLARLLREYGEERYAGQIARAIVRGARAGADRDDAGARGRDQVARSRRPAQFAGGHPAKRIVPGDPHRRQRRARSSSTRALPLAWDVLRPGGRLAAISFHSLEDRRVKRFLVDRARGCICPPDLPVCACGRDARGASCSRAARSRRRPARSPPTRAPSPRTCAAPASLEGPHDAAACRHARRTARRRASKPPRRRASRGPRRDRIAASRRTWPAPLAPRSRIRVAARRAAPRARARSGGQRGAAPGASAGRRAASRVRTAAGVPPPLPPSRCRSAPRSRCPRRAAGRPCHASAAATCRVAHARSHGCGRCPTIGCSTA